MRLVSVELKGTSLGADGPSRAPACKSGSSSGDVLPESVQNECLEVTRNVGEPGTVVLVKAELFARLVSDALAILDMLESVSGILAQSRQPSSRICASSSRVLLSISRRRGSMASGNSCHEALRAS